MFTKALDIEKNTGRTFIIQVDEIDKLRSFISSQELLDIVNQSNSGNGSAKSKYINRLLLIAGNSIENTIRPNNTIYGAMKSRAPEVTLCNLQYENIINHYTNNLKKLEKFKNIDNVGIVINQLKNKIEENLSNATDKIATYIRNTIEAVFSSISSSTSYYERS